MKINLKVMSYCLVISALAILFAYLAFWQHEPNLNINQPTPTPVFPTNTTQEATQETPSTPNPQSLYLLINAHRKESNLSPLKPSNELEQSARLKLEDMISKKYYRHQDIQGNDGWHFLKQAGYDYILAGENLAFQLNSEWQIISSWIESPDHNQQLLEPKYEDMGVVIDCSALKIYADGGCISVLHLGLD
jgi:uncharacterized protein YkwD